MAESRTLLALHQADAWQDMLQVKLRWPLKYMFNLLQGADHLDICDRDGSGLSLQHDCGQDLSIQVWTENKMFSFWLFSVSGRALAPEATWACARGQCLVTRTCHASPCWPTRPPWPGAWARSLVTAPWTGQCHEVTQCRVTQSYGGHITQTLTNRESIDFLCNPLKLSQKKVTFCQEKIMVN